MLSNSPGGSTDWLALSEVGSADTNFLQNTYVGAGVNNRTWVVTMPSTPGSYEFRLYLNNTYTVATRSPAVTVVAVNPTPAISSLNPSGVNAGSDGFSLTINGSNFVKGVMATVAGQARAVTFVSAKRVTISLSAADVAAAGNVAIRIVNPAACACKGCTSNVENLAVVVPRHRRFSR